MLAVALSGGCGTTAGGGGGAGQPVATIGGKPDLACSKDGHFMGCYFGVVGGGGTVVKCDPDKLVWAEVEVCAGGMKCVEDPKPGGPSYIKTASCKVDNTPATDTTVQDAGSTDGAGSGDGSAGGSDGQAGTDGGGVPSDGGGTTKDTIGPKDTEQPPKDTSEPKDTSGPNDTWEPTDTGEPKDSGGPKDTWVPPDTSDPDGGGPQTSGCKNKCGSQSKDKTGKTCWCDEACHENSDCCADKLEYCPKAKPDVIADVNIPDTKSDGGSADVAIDIKPGDTGKDGGGTQPGTCKGKECKYDGAWTCQCDSACEKYNDCCADKKTYCKGDGG